MNTAHPSHHPTTLTQSAGFQTSPVATIAAAHAVHDTYNAFLPALLPRLIETLSISTTQAGVLSILVQAPSIIQPFIGSLADRTNLRALAILGPAATGAAMSLMGVAETYPTLVLLMFLAGVSLAAFHAVAPVMVGNFSGNRLGRGMSFWMVGGEVGRTIGPILAVTAVGYFTLKGLPVLMIGGFLMSLVLFFRFRNVNHRAEGVGDSFHWMDALRRMRSMLAPMTAIILLRAWMESSLMTYLPTFLRREGADLWLAGAAFTLMETTGMAGAMVGGSLSDHFGRRRALGTALLLAPLAMLLFILTDDWRRVVGLLAVGFTSMAINPIVMAIFQESLPENRALANGMYQAIHLVIRSITVYFIGVMGDTVGLRFAFIASAVVGLLTLPLVWLAPSGRLKKG